MAGYDDLATLSNLQSQEAQFFGNDAAKVADPYGYQRRNRAGRKFDRLLSDPGSMRTSPFFRYLRNQAMNATRAGNAAGGFRNSGRGQLALQEAAQGSATKAFFPLAELYGKASGALNPLSPAAAALALSGSNRSQDYRQMEGADRALADRYGGGNLGTSTPWWMQGSMPAFPLENDSYADAYSSGGALPYSSSWSPSYMPSSGSGSGYITSDSGTSAYGPLSGFQSVGDEASGFDPAAYAEQDYWGYS